MYVPFIPAYAPFSAMYCASGFTGQLSRQSVLFAVTVRTVTSESRSLITLTVNVPREVGGGRGRRRRGRRHRGVAVQNGHGPEDAEVLHPRRSLDERPEVEAVVTRRLRRLDRELEPRDLTRTDVRRGLHGDAVVARP